MDEVQSEAESQLTYAKDTDCGTFGDTSLGVANAMETKQFYIGSFELLRSYGRFKRLLLETNQPSGFSDFSISRIVSVPGSGIAASTDGTTQSNRSSL